MWGTKYLFKIPLPFLLKDGEKLKIVEVQMWNCLNQF